MNAKSIPFILLLGLLFGATLVVSRFSVDQFAPLTYIGFRFGLASLAYVVLYSFRIGGRTWPRGKSLWARSLLIGVIGSAIPMAGIVSSLQYLSSGLSSILLTVNPALTVLFAHFFLADERLTRRKGLGVLIALVGAILLVVMGETGLPDVDAANPLGYIFLLTGMLAGSIATIYVRKYMSADDPLDTTGIRMFTAALVLLPIAYFTDGLDVSQVNQQGVLALFFAAIFGTFFAFLLSFYNIQQFGATAAVMTSYVIPVVAGLIGLIFLNEQITTGMAVGMAFILLGMWLLNRNPPQAIQPAPATD